MKSNKSKQPALTEVETLEYALSKFANLTKEDFKLSVPYWEHKEYEKGDFYNEHKTTCQYLGFIVEGVFRSYTVDKKTDEEKNIFLYSQNQFVVTFKSFINQIPCDYYTQAIVDSKVIYLSFFDLQKLYKKSRKWETFGRLLAQDAFNVAIDRLESFVFKTPEERYLDLIKRHPNIFNTIPLYHISSYIGIKAESLSRIRKRISIK